MEAGLADVATTRSRGGIAGERPSSRRASRHCGARIEAVPTPGRPRSAPHLAVPKDAALRAAERAPEPACPEHSRKGEGRAEHPAHGGSACTRALSSVLAAVRPPRAAMAKGRLERRASDSRIMISTIRDGHPWTATFNLSRLPFLTS